MLPFYIPRLVDLFFKLYFKPVYWMFLYLGTYVQPDICHNHELLMKHKMHLHITPYNDPSSVPQLPPNIQSS
jgi:hypothetical protein